MRSILQKIAITPASPGLQQGFMSLETMFYLLISVTSLAIMAHWARQQVFDKQLAAEARQLQSISQYFRENIKDGRELPVSPPKRITFEPNDYTVEVIHPKGKELQQLWIIPQKKNFTLATCRQISRQIGLSAGCLEKVANGPAVVRHPLNLWRFPWPEIDPFPPLGQIVIVQTLALPPVDSSHLLLYRSQQTSDFRNSMRNNLNVGPHTIKFKKEEKLSQLNTKQWELTKNGQQLLLSNGPPDSGITVREGFKGYTLKRTMISPQAITLDNLFRVGESIENIIKIHKFLFVFYTEKDLQEKEKIWFVSVITKFLGWIKKHSSKDSSRKFKLQIYFRPLQKTSQLNQWWNKIPYHELMHKNLEKEQKKLYSNNICKFKTTEKEYYKTFGRLFIVGSELVTESSTLFICVPDDKEGIRAQPWFTIPGNVESSASQFLEGPREQPATQKKLSSITVASNLRTQEDVEELISFLIILSQKLREYMNSITITIKINHFSSNYVENFGLNRLFYEKYSAIDPKNRKEILTEFKEHYNDSRVNINKTIRRKMDKLHLFLKELNKFENLPKELKQEIDSMIKEIVEEYYSDSKIITLTKQ